MFGKLKNSLVSGGSIAFLVFLLWGSIVLLGLFLSTHSRDPGVIEEALQGRWSDIILLWEEYGYLSHGGLWFSEPLLVNPTHSLASFYTLGFLQIAHLDENH